MRYKVDLKNFMARCESNYQRLRQIFPDLSKDQRCLGLTNSQNREVVLSVKERTPFTTLLLIEERMRPDTGSVGINWSKPPALTVRMYHDAKLAEVVSCDAMRGIKPKNEYPNRKMLQRDEKAQWNRFLEEWLTVCQKQGYVIEPVFVLSSGEVE